MFHKYLTKKIGLGTNQLLRIRPASPAPDLNYFRNNVSSLLKIVSTYMYFFGPMLATVLIFSGFLPNSCCRSIVLFHILKTIFYIKKLQADLKQMQLESSRSMFYMFVNKA